MKGNATKKAKSKQTQERANRKNCIQCQVSEYAAFCVRESAIPTFTTEEDYYGYICGIVADVAAYAMKKLNAAYDAYDIDVITCWAHEEEVEQQVLDRFDIMSTVSDAVYRRLDEPTLKALDILLA